MRTTSLLVDHDILIDAGTGLSDLPLDELAAIDHVFITHSHLDHIAALPLMVDSVSSNACCSAIQSAVRATAHANPLISMPWKWLMLFCIWSAPETATLPERSCISMVV